MRGDRRAGARLRGDRGQVMIISALLLVPLLVIAALVIDLGSLINGRQDVRIALDAAALAAAADLPVTGPSEGNAAVAVARAFAAKNDATLSGTAVAVTFGCIVPDENGDGQADSLAIPRDCDPGAKPFTCTGGRCVADCTPSSGDKCNAIAVSSGKAVPYGFAKVMGVNQGATGTQTSAACRGACGASVVSEADLVLIVDRSGSMSATDLANAKGAARDMLLFLDPSAQRVALGVLGPSRTNQTCGSPNSGAHGVASPNMNNITFIASPWPQAAPASDYQSGGALNPSSKLVQTINCLNTSGTGTDLGSPMWWARSYLDYYGRPEAVKGIILMTDGEANEPTSQSCKYAKEQADAARASGIQVVTIGFGVAGANCADSASPAPSPYRTAGVTRLLADMASAIDGVPADDNGCTAAENTDGDNFFCEPRTSDLSQVFVSAAAQIISSSPKLIALP